MDYKKLTDDCEHLARLGGRVAMEHFRPIRAGTPIAYDTKHDSSPVTRADRETQAAIVEEIHQRHPDSLIIGEEDAPSPARHTSHVTLPSLCWVIDPIDGTRNFMSGSALWCVCVAALVDATPVAAAIYNPCDDVLWKAGRGLGTTRNGQAVRVCHEPLHRNSLMACPSPQNGKMPVFSERWQCRHTPRNLGSAGLHLSYVADGTFMAAGGPECKLWDMAAGWLLVREAGGQCTGLDGNEIFPFDLAGYHGQCVPWLATGEAYQEVLKTVLA